MYGSRGSILHHYGWTWDYLLWGIKWHLVEKMMIDAPGYEYPKKDKNGKSESGNQTMALTNQNKHEIMAFLNSKQ